MDNVTSLLPRLASEQSPLSATVHGDHQPNSDGIELTLSASSVAPPPQLPPRGQRPVDLNPTTVGCELLHLRPCPPVPPAPPLPAREPIPLVHGSHIGCTNVIAAVRNPTTRIDQVVPLARWPLPLSTLTVGNANGNGGSWTRSAHERTHVSLEPLLHRVPTAGVVGSSVNVTDRALRTPLQANVVSGRHSKVLEPHGNEYVDSPTLRSNVCGLQQPNRTVPATAVSTCTGVRGSAESFPAARNGDSHRATTVPAVVVTQPTSKCSCPTSSSTQPVSGGGIKDKLDNAAAASSGRSGVAPLNCRGGILCSRCGLCRCANCTAPRELPRRWIGDFECSVQRCVGVTSCLCCVQAIFYHCLDGSGNSYPEENGVVGAADDPCACCERPRCCVRWTIMGALATSVLPCLCCYCPMQCAVNGLTLCYNSCATPRGCRCRACSQEASSSGGSTHGLLADSESSST